MEAMAEGSAATAVTGTQGQSGTAPPGVPAGIPGAVGDMRVTAMAPLVGHPAEEGRPATTPTQGSSWPWGSVGQAATSGPLGSTQVTALFGSPGVSNAGQMTMPGTQMELSHSTPCALPHLAGSVWNMGFSSGPLVGPWSAAGMQ